MQAPEEDRVTCLELYSPDNIASLTATIANLPGLKGTSLPGEGIAAFKKWVNEEWEKGNPVPYLKLVWVEWFCIPFSSLPGRNLPLGEWKYIPSDKSNLTSYSQFIRRFEARPIPDGSSIERVRKTFQEVFTILQERYGPGAKHSAAAIPNFGRQSARCYAMNYPAGSSLRQHIVWLR